ncbi:MAG TPA: histidine kinase dimerization/phosphoacceptor domain -containing protein [Methanobacteriaceae archaeon]|nr:histidine kinase dimerization/phosphoacceptor domain -containing protein [Methanobacteriaceae archaeon]
MSIYSILSISAAALVFSLGYFIYYQNQRQPLNQLIAIFSFLLSYLLFIGFGLNQASDLQMAYLWVKAGFLWPFIPAILLHIVLVFTNYYKKISSWLLYPLLYLPPVVIAILELGTKLITNGAILTSWGWTYTVPVNPLFYDISNIWGVFMAVLAIAIGGLFLYNQKNEVLREQTIYILIGLYLPVLFGTFTDILLPFQGIDAPTLASLAAALGIAFISYGVWRYRLPTLSDRLTRNITSHMSNLMIIIDSKGNIWDVNPAALELLDYSRDQLLDLKMDSIFFECKDNVIEKYVKLAKPQDNLEVNFQKSDGSDILILLSISPIGNFRSGVKGLLLIGIDLTQRKEMENHIKESLKEKELLLREIHHRVKNNMQIISSLLNLQSMRMDGKAAAALKDSQNRVKSMAMIHEKLYYSTDLDNLDFADYINSLVSSLFSIYSTDNTPIKLEIDVENISLNLDTAIPCGLIINELVTNSLKHAFPSMDGAQTLDGYISPEEEVHDVKGGWIYVGLHELKEGLELIVEDNGVGLPDDLKSMETENLGLQVVNSLVRQLDGNIEVKNGHGTHYRVNFHRLNYKPRF